MDLWKFENIKQIAFGMGIVIMLLIFTTRPSANAQESWNNNVYNVGNGIEVSLDILNSNGESINDTNKFYNGQAVNIKLDWKAIEKVTSSAALTINLPVNLDSSKISFESPLVANKITNEDTTTKAELYKDGSTIIVSFYASEQTPIEQSRNGSLVLEHNVFVTPYATEFNAQKLDIKLISDINESNNMQPVTLSKEVTSISNGIKLDTIKITKPKLTSTNSGATDPSDGEDSIFDGDGIARLSFSYSGGTYGIKNKDVLLFKLNDFGEGDKVGKLTTNGNSMVINASIDGSIVDVGVINFIKISEDSNSYARIQFNENFKQNLDVKGFVSMSSNILFEKSIDSESIITIDVNGVPKEIKVTGPVYTRTSLVLKNGEVINNNEGIRWTLIVNEEDLSKEFNSNKKLFYPLVSDVLVEDKLADDNQYIDVDSIRIVKTLGNFGSKDYTKYSIDEKTLRDTTNNLYKLNIMDNKVLWDNKTGLTIEEFEQYIGKSDIIKYINDDKNMVKGFSLQLGDINERKGVDGSYSFFLPNNSKDVALKDNKPFGYIVYYNTILTGSSGSVTTHSNKVIAKSGEKEYESSKEVEVFRSTSGGDGKKTTLKILKVDQKNKPIENIYFEVVNKNNYKDYKFTAATSASGYVEFPQLTIGKYILTEKESDYYEVIAPVEFEVTNDSNLNLVASAISSDIKDIVYKNMSFLDTQNNQKDEDINVITNNIVTGQFQINKKDADTKALLTGAEFAVYDINDERLSGEAGTIVISNNGTGKSAVLPLGDYYLIETKAPNGYELSTTKLPIKLNSSKEIIVFDIYNKAKGSIRIFKYDSENKPTGDSFLEGTKFNLYNANDDTNVLETITIDKDGYGLSKKWPYGNYNLVEIYAPAGYYFTNKKIPVTINSEYLDGGHEVRISVANSKLPPTTTTPGTNEGNITPRPTTKTEDYIPPSTPTPTNPNGGSVTPTPTNPNGGNVTPTPTNSNGGSVTPIPTNPNGGNTPPGSISTPTPAPRTTTPNGGNTPSTTPGNGNIDEEVPLGSVNKTPKPGDGNIDEEVPLGSVITTLKPTDSGSNSSANNDSLTDIDENTPIGNAKPNSGNTTNIGENDVPEGKLNPKTSDSFKAYNLILISIVTASLLGIRWFLDKYSSNMSK